MPGINEIFERQQLRNIASTSANIKLFFDNAIIELSLTAQYVTYRGGIFSLDSYPALKQKIEELLPLLHDRITIELINGIKQSWDISNRKNDTITDRRLAGKEPTPERRQQLYDPNIEARDAFIRRKEKGLNLSDRVWNTLEPFKSELERGLAVGISEGQPASEMARNLRKYLVEPDRLVKKIRDSKGVLRLSKAAESYHPGSGVARSSFSNAKRLAVTEVSMAYKAADFERWQNLPFVLGQEIKLSNNHPSFDICDHLRGTYPKQFRFVGWHPRCRCFSIPILATQEQMNELEGYTLGISDKRPKVEQVIEMPDKAKRWFSNNAERVNRWSNTPYWKRDNPKYLSQFFKK